MNRIDHAFADCRRRGAKSLVMFVSAGDPSLEVTEELIPGLAAAGADVVEVGVPFSDPMADGPTIQAASQRALKVGTTLEGILAMVARVRRRTDVPMVLFSYYNVLLQYGVQRLAQDAAAAGVDGVLVVDVPAEESDEVRPALRSHGLKWVTLLAPTTSPERARSILAEAEGFVYYITVKGVTGARGELPSDLEEHLRQIRALTDLPVVAGFGVSGPKMARRVAANADGVVVGSALIKTLQQASCPDSAVEAAVSFVRGLREGLDAPD